MLLRLEGLHLVLTGKNRQLETLSILLILPGILLAVLNALALEPTKQQHPFIPKLQFGLLIALWPLKIIPVKSFPRRVVGITTKELLPVRIRLFPVAPNRQVPRLSMALSLKKRNAVVPLGEIVITRKLAQSLTAILLAAKFKFTLLQPMTEPIPLTLAKVTDVRKLPRVPFKVLSRVPQLVLAEVGPPQIFKVAPHVFRKALSRLENPQPVTNP